MGEKNIKIDKAFIWALQSGDEGAWERLYTEALCPLRGQIAARYHSLSQDEVDDVWACAIETVYTKIGTLRKPGSLRAWLWTIARNTATKYVGNKQVHVPLDDHQVVISNDGQEQQGDTLEELRRLLANASPPHATVLLAKVGQAREVPDGVVYYLTGLRPEQQWGTIGGLRRRTGAAS